MEDEIKLRDVKLPIAEIFTSIQGEGLHAGIPMTFVRLAGCTVGKRYEANVYQNNLLPIFVNCCQSFDQRSFPCDTDYRMKEQLTVAQILVQIPEHVHWVSITGGEPFMHGRKLIPLIDALRHKGLGINIETSGTIVPEEDLLDRIASYCYLVCSPKLGYIDRMVGSADEVRLVVDKDFNLSAAEEILRSALDQVFLCPLSEQEDVTKIDKKSMEKCIEIISMPAFSDCRISIQMHKVLNVR